MSSNDHLFLFSSLNSKKPLTARKTHLRRLYDILQLSIQRHEFPRAKRAWAVLARCKEIDWKALWTTGLLIIGECNENGPALQTSVDYLRTMMLQRPEDRTSILKELVFRLLLQNKCRDALDELELYLPSLPYQNNPTLHIYAALASIYLAQRNSGMIISRPMDYGMKSSSVQAEPSSRQDFDSSLMRDAQIHLEHAKTLDSDSIFIQGFLEKIHNLQDQEHTVLQDSDDESMTMEDSGPGRKRIRV